jgi:EthD domain-containing protein
MTHDGFSELWFDDLAQLQHAATTPEWQAAVEDGNRLFAQPVGLVIARERIQKDFPPAAGSAR